MNHKEEDLKEVLANVFGINKDSVNNDASIDTIEAWDSLKHLNLILALEERFNVSFTEEETVEILNYDLIKITLEKHDVKFTN